MRLKDYDDREGKKVWLSEREMNDLLKAAETSNVEQQMALLLAGRCGLRRAEIVDVTPADVVRTDHGDVVRVWEGKGDKYREVPAPDELITLLRGVGLEPDEPLVDVNPSTIYQFVRRAREARRAETGDEGWQFVGPHDLRRSWGVILLENGTLPSVVMEWGGWKDWQTFRDHYLAEFSPEALRRERAKLPWDGGVSESSSTSTNSYATVQTERSSY